LRMSVGCTPRSCRPRGRRTCRRRPSGRV